MSACDLNFCCAPDTCSNIATRSISVSSNHKLCESHLNLSESLSIKCGYCKSLIRIDLTLIPSKNPLCCTVCQSKLVESINSTICTSCLNFCSKCGSLANDCFCEYYPCRDCSKYSEIKCECSSEIFFCKDHYSSHFLSCRSPFNLIDEKVQNPKFLKECKYKRKILIMIEILTENLEKYHLKLLNYLIKSKNFKVKLIKKKIIEAKTVMMSLFRELERNIIFSGDDKQFVELIVRFKIFEKNKNVLIDVIISIFHNFFEKIEKFLVICYKDLNESRFNDDSFIKILQELRNFYCIFVELYEITQVNLEPIQITNSENFLTFKEELLEENIKKSYIEKIDSAEISDFSQSVEINITSNEKILEENIKKNYIEKIESAQISDYSDKIDINETYLKNICENQDMNGLTQIKTLLCVRDIDFTELKAIESSKCIECDQLSSLQLLDCGHKFCKNCSTSNKCNISMNESLKCVKCNTNSTKILKCDHCFNGYCPTCMQKHELQLKNPNSCSKCSVSQDTQKLNCDHIFCSDCLDSSNEACSICHPIHVTCSVCAREGFQKMKFKYCIDIGCKSCKIYDFCYKCILSMDQNALKINIKFEKLNINCQVCEKTKDHLIEMICKHFVCLSCLKNIENYDYLCLSCYEQSSTKFCVRCKIKYELEFLEGSIYKSCCSTLIREKRSFRSKVKNFFMR